MPKLSFSVGLGSILFAISIDNADLNLPSNLPCDAEPLVPSLTQSDPVIAGKSLQLLCFLAIVYVFMTLYMVIYSALVYLCITNGMMKKAQINKNTH